MANGHEIDKESKQSLAKSDNYYLFTLDEKALFLGKSKAFASFLNKGSAQKWLRLSTSTLSYLVYYCRPKKLNPFDLAYFEDPHAEISFKNVVK